MRGRFTKAIEGTLKAALGPPDVHVEATSYVDATFHQRAGLRKRVWLDTLASYDKQGVHRAIER